MRRMRLGLASSLILLLAGCTGALPAALPSPTAAPEATLVAPPTAAASPTIPPAPTATAAPPPIRVPTASPTAIIAAQEAIVCSPLEGISLDELGQPDLLKHPFDPPRPGRDDGHHGADFAYWSRGDRATMQGLPVHAALAGRVAGVLPDRPPYGNAVIIETPLEALPAALAETLLPLLPAPQPTLPPDTSLYCPPDPVRYEHPRRSLYLLYAHLDIPSTLQAGEDVSCGQPVGEVGTTGKSVNFHLHLEARIGPSAAAFPAIAHYDTSASPEEMSAYCTWRVSGLFQMLDPMLLFPPAALQP